MKSILKSQRRIRRHRKIRSKISGTSSRPRLTVFRSNKHMSAQLVDDDTGKTLAFAGDTRENSAFEKDGKGVNKTSKARIVGLFIAKEAKKKKISKVLFDRSGYLYAGRVRALAEGAREGGLDF